MQWHRLGHMQSICTSFQTDNHTNTLSLNFTGQMLFLTPNQERQSTEGNTLLRIFFFNVFFKFTCEEPSFLLTAN